MIFIPRVVTISRGTSYIDDQIILFKGDRNVEVQITLKNNPFKSKDGSSASCAQLIIDREAGPLFSEISQISNNRISFVITGEMIDDFEELGDYNFQIVLFNQDQTSRVTLPIVYAGIVIKEPLYEETIAGRTYANNERAVLLASNDSEEVFDDNGDYNRTNWNSGDIITDTKLNKIEEALFMINNDVPTDYATEEYVDNQRRQIETYAEIYTNNAVAQINTNNFATYTYVDNEIMKLDINQYATQEYVDDAVSNVSGGGGNVDLTGYATEAYVDQALTNYPTHKEMKSVVKDMVTTSMSDMPDIMEIRGEFFASNYFTEDDYKDGLCKVVLFNEVVFAGGFRRGELVRMTLGWDKATSTRTITIDSILGYTETYSVQADESLMIESRKTFATDDTINSILGKRNYATQDYVNEQIANVSGGSGGSNLDIMVIGDDDPNESYYFTGNEFTKDDYNNRMCKSVLMRNRVIIKAFDEFGNEFRQTYNNELVYVQLRNNDRREIYIYSPRGRQDSLYLTEDGVLQFIDSSSYATYTAIDIALENQIGNINAILDSINGEEI